MKNALREVDLTYHFSTCENIAGLQGSRVYYLKFSLYIYIYNKIENFIHCLSNFKAQIECECDPV